MDKRSRARKLNAVLKEMYPVVNSTLHFENPLQILVATQLAAQSTDVQVNIVTRELFKKYKTALDYAEADLAELERDVHSTGFYHNKAKNLKECGIRLVREHGGNVPGSMTELLALPGVGRKTANVVLGAVFHIPGIIVDTHAGRLSRRMGLSAHEDPGDVEKDLMKLLPKRDWTDFSHRLVFHGRAVCGARKPGCDICRAFPYCEYGQKNAVTPGCQDR